jgi:hypothetical protein
MRIVVWVRGILSEVDSSSEHPSCPWMSEVKSIFALIDKGWISISGPMKQQLQDNVVTQRIICVSYILLSWIFKTAVKLLLVDRVEYLWDFNDLSYEAKGDASLRVELDCKSAFFLLIFKIGAQIRELKRLILQRNKPCFEGLTRRVIYIKRSYHIPMSFIQSKLELLVVDLVRELVNAQH